MEERRQRYIREPWLMIRDEFRQSFPGIDGEIWERWIEAACAEFDVRIVREWHEQARNAAAKPDNWHFLRLFLNKCADKARQDQQPAAPEGKQP
jgi:hypothetical protein